MMSTKMEKILDKLSSNYMPFTELSRDRIAELVNVVRFIELREGEIFQIRGTNCADYLYVIEGTLEVISNGSVHNINKPEDTQKHPFVLPCAPDMSTIVARKDCIICHAEREILDDLIAWDEVFNIAQENDIELSKKMEKVRNTLVFRRLPLEVIETAFKKMSFSDIKAGDDIITIGEEGDSYYIIAEGTADVFQIGLYDDEPVQVASLVDGDAFGCEALISGAKRNETVKATTDCSLLILHKDDFNEIIKNPLIRSVHPNVAKPMIETGYKTIDVRYEEEFDDHHIPDSILIPLHELRNRMQELDKNDKYIVYCHGGGRSAVATLLLAQNQFEVASLEGGIRDWPFETASAA